LPAVVMADPWQQPATTNVE